jgi:cyclophilin family peptidyl-prolyl cis-trans isomerase
VDFSALTVGVALSGRDTGSSQFFVTLSPQPQLDGDYAAIGRADPEWAGVAEGDIVQHVEVR